MHPQPAGHVRPGCPEVRQGWPLCPPGLPVAAWVQGGPRSTHKCALCPSAPGPGALGSAGCPTPDGDRVLRRARAWGSGRVPSLWSVCLPPPWDGPGAQRGHDCALGCTVCRPQSWGAGSGLCLGPTAHWASPLGLTPVGEQATGGRGTLAGPGLSSVTWAQRQPPPGRDGGRGETPCPALLGGPDGPWEQLAAQPGPCTPPRPMLGRPVCTHSAPMLSLCPLSKDPARQPCTGSRFLHLLTDLRPLVLDNDRPQGCQVLSHDGFDLHCPEARGCRVIFHGHVGHLCVFSSALPNFELDCLLFFIVVEFLELFTYSGINPLICKFPHSVGCLFHCVDCVL